MTFSGTSGIQGTETSDTVQAITIRFDTEALLFLSFLSLFF